MVQDSLCHSKALWKALSHFTDKETEAQRGEATHSTSLCQNSNFQVFSLPMMLPSDLVSLQH